MNWCPLPLWRRRPFAVGRSWPGLARASARMTSGDIVGMERTGRGGGVRRYRGNLPLPDRPLPHVSVQKEQSPVHIRLTRRARSRRLKALLLPARQYRLAEEIAVRPVSRLRRSGESGTGLDAGGGRALRWPLRTLSAVIALSFACGAALPASRRTASPTRISRIAPAMG